MKIERAFMWYVSGEEPEYREETRYFKTADELLEYGLDVEIDLLNLVVEELEEDAAAKRYKDVSDRAKEAKRHLENIGEVLAFALVQGE